MGQHDALRRTGRTRRVDQVGGVVGTQGTPPVGVRDRGGRLGRDGLRDVRVVQHHPVERAGDSLPARSHRDTHCGTAVGEHPRYALRGIVRVHRHEGRARPGHRPHREHRRHRSRQAQRDVPFRPGSHRDQVASQPIRPLVELPVRQLAAVAHHCEGIGIARGRGEQIGQEQGRRVRGAARGRQPGQFVRVQDPDITDGPFRIGRGGLDDSHETIGEALHGLPIEQVGRERHDTGDPCGLSDTVEPLTEHELEVLLDHSGADRHALEPQPGQLDASALVVLELQGDLEQRRIRSRTGGVEFLHDTLERHVGVREGTEIDVAHRLEKLRERSPRIDSRAEREGPDEHSDEIVEGPLATARDGGTDHDVIGVPQPGEQHRQGRVNRHEQARAVIACERQEPAVQPGIERELDPVAAEGLLDRPRTIARQPQQVRRARQRLGPVGELAGPEGARIVLVAQERPLPQCVVGVLDGQRIPVRRPTGGPCDVRLHQIARQRPQRQPVDHDVVRNEDQDMQVRSQLEQSAVDRNSLRHVESRRDDRARADRQLVVARDRHRLEVDRDLGGRADVLDRAGGAHRKTRAQRLVPGEDVADGRTQRRRVESPGQAHRHRHVVRGRGRVELVDEPHPLLRRRQRDLRGARHHLEHGTARRPGVGVLDPLGKRGRGGGLEQRPHAEVDAQ